MIEPSDVEARLRAGIPGLRHVALRDLTGTRDHYEAVLVAAEFDGKSKVARHQVVYRALGELMAGPIHALTMRTLSPTEYAAEGGENAEDSP